MKKIITLGLTAAVILTVGTTTAFAASPTRGTNYTDSDNDGVCDNIATRGSFGTYANFVDEDGDGICDNTGRAIGQGKGNSQGFGIGKNGGRFVDADGDSVNDNIGSGNGGFFTDADGDGECDNIGTRQGSGKNAGTGKGRNR